MDTWDTSGKQEPWQNSTEQDWTQLELPFDADA